MKKALKRAVAFTLALALSTITLGAIPIRTSAAAVPSGKITMSAAEVSDITVSRYPKIEIRVGGKDSGMPAYLINDTTYVPLRAFSDAICASNIQYNASTRTATVTSPTLTLTATDASHYICANGRYLYSITPIRILSDNSMYVPVRLLAKAMGVNVEWKGDTRSVHISGSYKPILSGDQFYNQNDLYWLSRIISSESRGEPLLGQIAVGNVVQNRVSSRLYPNTIYGVIFDKVGGTQFSPVSFGTIYNTPYSLSVIAAKICLEGFTVSDQILFFFEPISSTTNWISRNRPYAFTIGAHWFYC